MWKFKWHEEVRVVRGYTRSLIYDLRRREHKFISNEVYSLIKQFEGEEKKVVEDKLDSNFKNWFEDFYEKEYFFYVPEKIFHNFTELSLEWDYPSLISNIIIDVSNISNKLSFNINDIGSRHIALRFLQSNISVEGINNFLEKNILNTIIQSIDIYIENSLNEELMKESSDRFPFINNWVISKTNNKTKIDDSSFGDILYLKPNSSDKLIPNFIIDIGLYTESQKHHCYFNRKLYIGTNGEIKNAPECEKNFGFIQDITNKDNLNKIISSSEFQEFWYVNKESCDVCSICEFKAMCIENRIPKKRNDGSWYHNIECAYNPYICKWEGEEGYQTLEECGIISKEDGYKIDTNKVDSINEVIWFE